VSAYPNIILPLCGGIFIDKLGLRLGAIIFAGIIALGQGIFTVGGFITNFPVMVAGRFVLGVGSEAAAVA